MKRKDRRRFLLILGAILIFAGSIALSILKIRYSVQGIAQSELNITRLSTTHRIERTPDGHLSFIAVVLDTEEAKGKEGGKGTIEPCPT